MTVWRKNLAFNIIPYCHPMIYCFFSRPCLKSGADLLEVSGRSGRTAQKWRSNRDFIFTPFFRGLPLIFSGLTIACHSISSFANVYFYSYFFSNPKSKGVHKHDFKPLSLNPVFTQLLHVLKQE